MHIFMHGLLYAVLVHLLAQPIPPVSPKAMLVLVGLGLLVGCLQECLQLLSEEKWPGWPPEILDLSVDLIGATIGIGLSRLTLRIQRSANT
jgi:VanZ family protein